MTYFFKIVIYFLIYSFFGFIFEVIYCSIGNKKLMNRGFLYSSLCPIYGLSVVVMIIFLYKYKELYYIIVPLSLFLSLAIEYFTSYLLEKFFSIRLWDYSNYKFNLNGRICLINSLIFLALIILVIYVIHPNIIKLVNVIPSSYLYIISPIFLVLIFFDIVLTLISLIKFNKILTNYFNSLDNKISFSFTNKVINNFDRIYNHIFSKYPSFKVGKKYNNDQLIFDKFKETYKKNMKN